MQLPDMRKPVTGEVTGLLEIEKLAGAFDRLEDSPNRLHLQAVRIRNRFTMSWPVARAVACLAYGEARP